MTENPIFGRVGKQAAARVEDFEPSQWYPPNMLFHHDAVIPLHMQNQPDGTFMEISVDEHFSLMNGGKAAMAGKHLLLRDSKINLSDLSIKMKNCKGEARMDKADTFRPCHLGGNLAIYTQSCVPDSHNFFIRTVVTYIVMERRPGRPNYAGYLVINEVDRSALPVAWFRRSVWQAHTCGFRGFGSMEQKGIATVSGVQIEFPPNRRGADEESKTEGDDASRRRHIKDWWSAEEVVSNQWL